ncbi:metallophosphoesterase family protein [Natronoglomus mannanivorans]|uniref:Phosphoesterase n=1 Tax=Natronoglomus mannanivorans TaxID=2979990 RepID=A0AAP2Z437_9EURY|nr:metallophosphatase family protein [Halobacteria archaeon AArc-xg1-1]
MKIGLLSDIHANLPALEAVLDDMPDVDRIVCAGDVIGYNLWPAECLEIIRETADITVMGNHDRTVETPHQYSANRMAEAGLEHAKRELTSEQLDWLRNLPRKASFADDRFVLVHDHPSIQDRYVYPAEFANLRRYLDDFDGIVLGHTHVQHKALIDDRWVVNPGSVGQPRDGDNRAAYATLDTDDSSVNLRRVSYDIDHVIACFEESVLPMKTATRLLSGE